MPNRILKESINESRGLSETSPFAQDLYKRLITYADDYGRFNSDPEIMRARLFPRELDAVTEADIMEALFDLVGVDKIRFYTTRVRERIVYGVFPNWGEHQRIRNTRAKCPEPGDYEVNDWAFRRCVPIALRIKIFERDRFTCQECGHDYSVPGLPLRQAMRLLSGVLHIDHTVPVLMGGRATEENLRLLCAHCNQSRPKLITCDDLLAAAASSQDSSHPAAGGGGLPRASATGGTLRPESNPIQSNPIRIQSESNHVADSIADEAQAEPEPQFSKDTEPHRLASLLKSLILTNNPTARLRTQTPKQFQAWCAEIDRMLRRDGRDPAHVEAVIRWAQSDPFWMANILSPPKLREKYDTLWLQMQRPSKEVSGNGKNRQRLAEVDDSSLDRFKAFD